MKLFEDSPKYDVWAKITLSFAPSLMLLLLIFIEYRILPTESEEEALFAKNILLASLVVITFVYLAFLPRRYEIHDDGVKIVLGIFTYSIPLKEIVEVRKAEKWKIFLYKGARFTTSIKNTVEIKKKNRISVLISPSNPEIFIEYLTNALNRVDKINKEKK